MFSRTKLTLFRMLGIEIKVDLSWFLIAILMTWLLSESVFADGFPALDGATCLALGLLGTLGLFTSIVLHELAHSLVAQRQGIRVREITLFLFGGVAMLEEEPATPWGEFTMAIAGPLMSLSLGLSGLALPWLAAGVGLDMPAPLVALIQMLGGVNVVLAVFNLAPGFPLDGGRILRAALWAWQGDKGRATRVASSTGLLLGASMALIGLVFVFQGDVVGGLWWVAIGWFLRRAARQPLQLQRFHEALIGSKVRDFVKADHAAVPRSIPVSELVTDFLLKYRRGLFPVVDGETLRGCVSVDAVQALPSADWERTTVWEITNPCSDENTVAADAPAEQAFHAMVLSGALERLVVNAEGQLLGVVSALDIQSYVTMKLELEPPQ